MESYPPTLPGGAVDIGTERMMGLIGSIIELLGFIPYIGNILSLLGFILILIALHGIGNKLGDERPFRNYLKGFIIILAGVIVAAIIVLSAFVVHSAGGVVRHEQNLGLIFAGIAVIIVAVILGAYFQKKAWEAMYEITGVQEFKKTADFLWWGVLTLIILVGFILLLVSAIYRILAFSNLPREISRRMPRQEVTGEDFTGDFTW